MRNLFENYHPHHKDVNKCKSATDISSTTHTSSFLVPFDIKQPSEDQSECINIPHPFSHPLVNKTISLRTFLYVNKCRKLGNSLPKCYICQKERQRKMYVLYVCVLPWYRRNFFLLLSHVRRYDRYVHSHCLLLSRRFSFTTHDNLSLLEFFNTTVSTPIWVKRIIITNFHSCTGHLDTNSLLFTNWCTIELL